VSAARPPGRAATGRPAPIVLSMLTVAGWALSLAVLGGRPELFVVALPLALALAALARRPAAPDYAVTHRVSEQRVFEGDGVAVTVSVAAASAVPLLELLEPMPPGTRIAAGRHRAVVTLRAGQALDWTYELGCPARGVHALGTIVSRAGDRRGVWEWERRDVERTLVVVHPHVVPLRSLPRPRRTQTSMGDYVSPALGEGIEPGDVRPFAPGDRVRQVNWRASLRQGTLYVTQHHRERNADVVLMLDTLAEAGVPPDTTLDWAVRAAASLATAYLVRKDRVGLIVYGGLIDWVRPGSGRIQYERLAGTLLRADVVFTYVAKDLALVPPRVLPPQALVIALTPLLDPRFTKAALDLAARGFDLVVVVVSPVQPTRAARRGSALDDLACRLWALDRRARLDELRRHGLSVLEWDPAEPLEATLSGLGRRQRRAAAVR
jgi:uncharacterized protein (DUF58 family)